MTLNRADQRALCPQEHEEQKAVVAWADVTRIPTHLRPHVGPVDRSGTVVGDYLVHIPNEGDRRKGEAGRQKAQGLRAGFPDLQLLIAMPKYNGLVIEMKRRPSYYPNRDAMHKAVTAEQKRWLKRLDAAGYAALVAFGAEVAEAAIKLYLGLEVYRNARRWMSVRVSEGGIWALEL